MASEVMSDARERQEITEELARYGCRVAQPDDPPLFTKEPKSTMQPFHWKELNRIYYHIICKDHLQIL